MEFLFRAFFAYGHSGLGKLFVELLVHDSEDDEIEKTYAEEGTAETYRSQERAAE